LTDVQAVGAPKPRATLPSLWPFLRLDHIFVGHGFAVRSASVPRQGLVRTASDHLPLVADLAVLR
jgi:endonuclease/exonuclease/phosphatase family metal-dependent hydrolase